LPTEDGKLSVTDLVPPGAIDAISTGRGVDVSDVAKYAPVSEMFVAALNPVFCSLSVIEYSPPLVLML
jgi:hypothetical protein